MSFADLHLHTYYSDGTYTPEELVSAAKKAGLAVIGVVDHDTVEGITPIQALAAGEGIEAIPGIELTCECDGNEIHILGYLLDHTNKELLKRLAVLKDNRLERMEKIVSKLAGLGVDLSSRDVLAIAHQGTVGRLHIARAMVKAKAVGSIYEAFQKYIGDKGPAYVLGFKLSPPEGIRLIKECGGIPVLAHPYTIRNDRLLDELIDHGFMGLEAYYPEHTQAMVNFYLNLAKEKGLLVTGGSDCHGAAKPEVKIGSMKVPYKLVEKLKQAKNRLEVRS